VGESIGRPVGRRRQSPPAGASTLLGFHARGELEPEGMSSDRAGAAPTLGFVRGGGVAVGERRCGGQRHERGWRRRGEEEGGGGPARAGIRLGFSLGGPFIRTQFGKK
jgi:hypothetical protein